MSGVCVDLADFLLRSLEMVAFNMKRLHPMSPADKPLSLSKEAVKSVPEKINGHFCFLGCSHARVSTRVRVKMRTRGTQSHRATFAKEHRADFKHEAQYDQ